MSRSYNQHRINPNSRGGKRRANVNRPAQRPKRLPLRDEIEEQLEDHVPETMLFYSADDSYVLEEYWDSLDFLEDDYGPDEYGSADFEKSLYLDPDWDESGPYVGGLDYGWEDFELICEPTESELERRRHQGNLNYYYDMTLFDDDGLDTPVPEECDYAIEAEPCIDIDDFGPVLREFYAESDFEINNSRRRQKGW